MEREILDIQGLRVETVTAEGRLARPILNNINLALCRGDVVGLIGESGAGKSTLGLAALGYARPGTHITGGKIFFNGQDLLKLPPRALRKLRGARIAYAAQSPAASFNPAKPLGRQVAEVLVLHRSATWREAGREASRLFAELDLPAPDTFGLRYPHQVSGGQLQRAMVAMAMACGPDLLILDEPTTALDVTTQVGVLLSVRASLHRHGTAAIFISHDLAVVAQLADRMLVLKDGEMVETAAAAELIKRPAHTYTRNLVDALTVPLAIRSTGPRALADEAQPAERDGTVPAARPAENDETVPMPGNAVPSTPPPAALSVASLTAGYRLQAAVKDVSLTIEHGKTLAVVGTSGSGKTSLARAICGLLPPDSGSVSLNGEPLPASFRQRTREQSRRIQLIYQSPDTALNPKHSIGTILGRVVSLHEGCSSSLVRERVGELLEMVGLPAEYSERRPEQLSGGQKQRIGIARALAARPAVIVCDEVTSSLDTLITVDILNLLRRVQDATGVAYLFITHDLGVVKRIADAVAVMQAGQIVEQGPVGEVFSNPAHPYTRLLLSAVPQMHVGWLNAHHDYAFRNRS